MVLDLAEKTFLLITGASRGIGRTMAIKLASKLKDESVIVLLARSAEGLASTKSAIEATSKAVKVQTRSIDIAQATAEQFRQLLQDSLGASAEKAENFERAFIIHNVGSVGDVSKCAKELADTAAWTAYYHLNLFSTVALNCEFLRVFSAAPSKLVVNLSSLCAVQPFESMSLYCSGKAARDMYFRVLAAEELKANNHSLLVLNYAPGAIDTDMTVYVQNTSMDPELSQLFKAQRDSKTMLTTEQTTDKFIQVLEEQKFKSGDHVDYWD